MLMRFDPFRDIDRLTSSLLGETGAAARSMPMDAYRSGDTFYVHFDVPGIDPQSIDLTVENNVLTVSARRAFDRSETDELVASERPQGVFRRQVFLGESLDTGKVEASYEAGVLTVEVPVLESARPRQIPVSIARGEKEAIETSATES